MANRMGGEGVSILTQWWDSGSQSVPRRRGRRTVETTGTLRFAFYGRLSTKEHQDSDSSRRWQLECAADVIADAGEIVAEYLDVGSTRRRAWRNRPQAAALLAAVTGGTCPFDAVVVGEYERAFCARQIFQILPILLEHGVQLWLPETLGPVDLDDPAHRAVIIELGARSMREVQRTRHRVTEAMRVQTRDQGRYLGGRPPYGYRLTAGGPHPTPSHARWGRRLQVLQPDPVTAPHVQWIFARRLTGLSMAGIARELNERQIPCPSAHDRARNGHRRATGWTVTTVSAILANPRYTGRQVWNRQSTHPLDPTTTGTPGPGGLPQRHRNQRQDWVISNRPAHPSLIDEADFVAAQSINAITRPTGGETRRYLLVGLIRCAACDRRMTSHWAHDRAWYRCEHGYTSAMPAAPGRPRTLYVREDRLLDAITTAVRNSEPRQDLTDPPAYLRGRDLMAVCDGYTIKLESDVTKNGHAAVRAAGAMAA